jgi:hypothetical protein
MLPRQDRLLYLRLMVVCISLFLVLVALRDLPVLNIFLVTNMICTTSFLPFLLGAWDSPTGRTCVTEDSMLFSIFSSVAAVSSLGISSEWGQLAGRGVLGDVYAGLKHAWMVGLNHLFPLSLSLSVSNRL